MTEPLPMGTRVLAFWEWRPGPIPSLSYRESPAQVFQV